MSTPNSIFEMITPLSVGPQSGGALQGPLRTDIDILIGLRLRRNIEVELLDLSQDSGLS